MTSSVRPADLVLRPAVAAAADGPGWPGCGVSPVVLVGFDDVAAADRAVAAIRSAARARAVAEAALAAAVVGLADLCDDRDHDSLEVAAVMCWTPRFAEAEVFWCRRVKADLPQVWSAWVAGTLDRHRARIFHDCLLFLLADGHLADAQRIAVIVLPKAAAMTGPQLRHRLNNLVLRFDPAARTRQIEHTTADRDLYLGDGGDGGTASLTAFNLPVARAAAAFERVDAIARARRAGGDLRTLAQLRADTVLDLLDGTGTDTPPMFRQGVLELQIPLATAIGADCAPADLAGYGPVLTDVARQIARDRNDLQWRFSVTYKGELVYQGITKTRPDPEHTASAGPRADRGADIAGTHDTGGRSRRGRGTCANSNAGDIRTSHGDNDASGASNSDPDTNVDGSSRATSRHDGGPDNHNTADCDHTAGEPNSAADIGDGGVGDGDDGFVRQTDIAQTSSPAALLDYLTGEPITAINTHVPCPPVETNPRTRFPGRKLRTWITTRDRTCQAPGCHAPARTCQYDHTTDHTNGGCTCHDNLALLCERHHREKHAGWWRIYQIRPGILIWVTPHGHIYRQLRT